MPGRNRRVRLLAIAACIITIFFLYERNSASYHLPAGIIGGGSVLRNAEKDPNAYTPPKAQQKEPERAAVYTPPEVKPIVEGPVVNPDPKPETKLLPQTTSTSTKAAAEAVAEPTTTKAAGVPAAEGKAPLPTLPPKAPYVGDDEDTGFGAYLEEVPGVGRLDQEPYVAPTYSSPPPVHWSKQPESWPVTSTIQLPTGSPSPIPRIQSAKKGADAERLKAIKEATKHAWKGYRDIGWGFDEVAPVSGYGKNSFNGWGATLVDSLDTLWIMGLVSEFEDAVNQTSYIDFTTSSRNDIPLFEVTIRYLGGLIAAYDVSGQKYRVLLDKAVELAEILYSAFDTPNRMPETYYYWKPAFSKNGHRASTRVVLAELGTLSLEFTRLSQLTKEPKYYDAIARITDAFEEWQNQTRLPGMWPIAVDASGCAKPVTIAPSRSYNQVPVPGGDSYMMSSEPVQGSKLAAEKAEAALDSTIRHAEGFTGDPSEDVPNLKQAAAGLNSIGRHAAGFTGDPSEDVPNLKQAAAEIDAYPIAGPDARLRKRQLDAVDNESDDSSDVVDPRVNAVKPQPLASEGSAATSEVVSEYKEPECVPQGLRSPSMNSMETFTMGGQSDSVYEYLPKEYLLLGGRLEQYKTMYLDSMIPTIEKLMFRPMTPENLDILISGELTISKNYTTEEWYETHIPKAEHLTCFTGGMLAMGGKIFNMPEHVEIGRKLTDGCIWSYNSTATGIMPESFVAAACKSKTDCKWNETLWHEELDPYRQYRDEQRATWIETYGEQALLTWTTPTPVPYRQGVGAPSRGPNFADSGKLPPKKHMPENLMYANNGHPTVNTQGGELTKLKDTSSFGTVEGAKAGVLKSTPEELAKLKDTNSFGTAEEAKAPIMKSTPEELAKLLNSGSLRDLQKRQIDEPASPQPQVMPTKSFPTEENESLVKSSFADDTEDGPLVAPPVPVYPPSAQDDDDPYEDPYAVQAPVYTPAPPPTHEEYVQQKIEDERLPPGFARYDSRKYILRPEAIESVFYMYRITGEQHWRDAGWEMFKAVERYTRVEFGHSAIDDISKTNPEHLDGMESFWIAETLKYFYLLFDEEEAWSLDEWVLNTEAHFFRRPQGPKV
ncbi:Putative glycoside hydrolase family 47, six-hairpin glycosidase-like superfamily [Septoria linicola]|uniref:alpha-1,2-Mannosidase n=1 Tax=Septoria linicola TaxID=215465 RepID=A0A9Q9ES44_9PEZI|nr:putative glycoside hydrolase family 47, six-hairpin glycosidase-like superfamily [Septoria linicola]USW59223.1 Putative glycoside hydrolase family 47, six-hairpin glycosidase-like superfamily [Septoria linicola]